MTDNKVYALAVLALVALGVGAFAAMQTNTLNGKVDALAASGTVDALDQRVSTLESQLLPKTAPAVLYFDSSDPFAKDEVAAAVRLAPVLEKQGLSITLSDQTGNTTALRQRGFKSLPVLFITTETVLENPSLEQAMTSQSMVDGGYAVDVFGLITTEKTMLGSECTRPNKTILYEFADYQCDGCDRLYYEVNDAVARLGDKVDYSFRQVPVAVRPQTRDAARAAVCADKQGVFDAYHALLFANYANLSVENLIVLAQEAGVKDMTKFTACLDEISTDNAVERDVTEALLSYKLTNTPAFVVNCKYVFTANDADGIVGNVCKAAGVCPAVNATAS
ncbi:hypothetical protein AUJ14_06100 [Candidatus Micrarchaeota archaeon CG1_02_55_22]|nr:MAG: hypothetical protein AUJ14_06100 [Candidatus Micrarchaeota archaeon CG1_02_55_22]